MNELRTSGNFLNRFPGLAEALKTEHPIVKEIAYKFEKYGNMSEKQAALVLKLAAEANRPKGEAPIGRVTVKATVINTKEVENMYRHSYYSPAFTLKMLVEFENGSRGWMTVPAAVEVTKGTKIEVTATFERKPLEPSFAFGKRPIVKVLEGGAL